MRCSECTGTYRKMHGKLTLIDKYVGQYTVPPIDYLECARCGGRLFSPAAAREVEAARERKLQGTLLSKPLAAFATATEAADLLGVTRQAFHKNRRITRGFIFQTGFGGKTVYLRESIVRFKKTGNGRFLLHPGAQNQQVEYESIMSTTHPAGLYDRARPASREWNKQIFGKGGTMHSVRRLSYAQEEASAVA